VKLYGYWRSSASWRVRIGLELKGLSYDYVPVHLVEGGGQQHAEAHRRRNPLRQVPVLELESEGTTHLLGQSMAILEYLEETYPTPPLLPRDPFARARVRQIAESINSGIQPLQNLAVLQHVKSIGADDKAWAVHWIGRGMEAVEALVRASAGTFCVGDQPTFADACLVPQLYAMRRFGLEEEKFPTLLRIEQACAELPAFQRAHASAQPDAQG
jgi:maleylpyruvate isomerase